MLENFGISLMQGEANIYAYILNREQSRKTAAIEIVVYASFISNRITDIASGCVYTISVTDVIARVIITGET